MAKIIQIPQRRLGAAMIVKDEEELLPGCLESIRDVVDELVVVDTGSSDRTIEIAKSYDAKVYSHQWTGDFSTHRNQSLQYVKSQFVLYIDADERLTEKAQLEMMALIDLLDNNQLNYAIMQIENDLPDGGSGLHIMPRIFRTGTVHFEGTIQNQPVTEGRGYISNLFIHHLGYALDPLKMEKKYREREMMLREALESQPENPLLWQYLVRNLRTQGEYIDCILKATETLESNMALTRSVEQMLMVDKLVSMIALEDPKAFDYCRAVIEKYPDNLDAIYYFSTLAMEKELLDDAIAALKRWLELRYRMELFGLHESVLIDTWGLKPLAYNNLGVAHWKKGQLIEALAALYVGRTLNSDLQSIHENMRQVIGGLLFKEGEMLRYFPELKGDDTGEEGKTKCQQSQDTVEVLPSQA